MVEAALGPAPGVKIVAPFLSQLAPLRMAEAVGLGPSRRRRESPAPWQEAPPQIGEGRFMNADSVSSLLI